MARKVPRLIIGADHCDDQYVQEALYRRILELNKLDEQLIFSLERDPRSIGYGPDKFQDYPFFLI